MTDNDIIKALECCYNIKENCDKCPCGFSSAEPACYDKIKKDALDLINRQKAEIERLTVPQELIDDDFCGVVCEFAEELIEKAKAEAVKEFAEKVKKYCVDIIVFDDWCEESKLIDYIEDLVNEMVGDSDAT